MGTIFYISLTIIVFFIIIFLQTRHIPKFALDFIQDHPVKIKLKWNENEDAWQFVIRFRICWFLFFPIWVTHHRTFFTSEKVFRQKMFFENYQSANDYINEKRYEYRIYNDTIGSKKNGKTQSDIQSDFQQDSTETNSSKDSFQQGSNFSQEKNNNNNNQKSETSSNATTSNTIELTAEEQFKEAEKSELMTKQDIEIPDIENISKYTEDQIKIENELLSKAKNETLENDFPKITKKKVIVKKKPVINTKISENEQKS